jgi:hypothetical protein
VTVPESNIVPADKGLRLKVLAGALLLAALAAVLWNPWTQLLDEIRTLGEDRPDLALKRLVFYARVIFGVGLTLAGLFGTALMRAAVRTIQSGRFPPPGMKVLRDTLLLTGTGAKMRAILLIAVTILLVGSQLFLFFYLPVTLEKIAVLKGP